MSVEENKAVAREFIMGISHGAFDDLYSPDYVHHNEAQYPGIKPGLAGFKAAVNGAGAGGAFADRTREITHLVAEGDLVVARFLVTGTHVGAFGGLPATGKRITFATTDIYRFENGKIVEGWAHVDFLDIVRRLGGRVVVD